MPFSGFDWARNTTARLTPEFYIVHSLDALVHVWRLRSTRECAASVDHLRVLSVGSGVVASGKIAHAPKNFKLLTRTVSRNKQRSRREKLQSRVYTSVTIVVESDKRRFPVDVIDTVVLRASTLFQLGTSLPRIDVSGTADPLPV